MSGSGSTAPVLVVPAEETTRNGCSPAALSRRIASSSASTRILKCSSTGIARIRSGITPARRADFTTEWCTWSDAYMTPVRMSGPSPRSLAQTIAVKFAVDPPVVKTPRVDGGNCIQSRIQSSTFASS